MLSDIFLDDDHIALITPQLRFGQPDGYHDKGVLVSGNLVLEDSLYVAKPRKITATPAPASPGVPTAGSPTITTRVLAGGFVTIAKADSSTTEVFPHGKPSSAFQRLKKMKAPYDVFEMLDAIREALLDLEYRFSISP